MVGNIEQDNSGFIWKNEAVRLMRSCRYSDALKLILPHLDSGDDDASALFLTILRHSDNVFQLIGSVDYIKERALAGDSIMQFAWARYNDAVSPEAESCSIAEKYYNAALKSGIADARMCLAFMYRDGDLGLVDRSRYFQERDRAVVEGSHTAVQQTVRDIVYGNSGSRAEPGKALEMLKKYIHCESPDIYLDPEYYALAGDAAYELGNMDDAASWYRRALNEGCMRACFFLALAAACDADGNISDAEQFYEIMEKGQELRCPAAFLAVQMAVDENDFENYGTELQGQVASALELDLETAYASGDSIGAYYLGCHYYDGNFGFAKNDETAWMWFSRGAARRDPFCYKMLAVMLRDENCSKKMSQDFLYECELRALRLGCEDMLDNVVDAYRNGFLTEYAAEIEQYYLPLSSNQNEEQYDNPDDDGRFDAWV
ncbi:MAG: hypothetical protein ACI3ZT_06045 [Candidatus Cryptobacteroides sp.]